MTTEAITARHSAIIGLGMALPPSIVTNNDLAQNLDTNDAWITERTGIHSRHIGSSTRELATQAARNALANANISPSQLDAVIVATMTPGIDCPSVAALVADDLAFSGATLDINAACSGFVYGLGLVNGLIATAYDKVLLIGAETMSSIVDPNDRRTAILFGDGAAAAVVSVSPHDVGMQSFHAGTDPGSHQLLHANKGEKLIMDGKEVYRRAIRATVDSAEAAMREAKVTADDIALFVPHQANLRIIEAVCDRIKIPMDKTVTTVDHTGNTSAASIPIALTEALHAGRLHDGDLLLLSGFGAGMTWASIVWKWGV